MLSLIEQYFVVYWHVQFTMDYYLINLLTSFSNKLAAEGDKCHSYFKKK